MAILQYGLNFNGTPCWEGTYEFDKNNFNSILSVALSHLRF